MMFTDRIFHKFLFLAALLRLKQPACSIVHNIKYFRLKELKKLSNFLLSGSTSLPTKYWGIDGL